MEKEPEQPLPESPEKGERIAKVMARAGLCSRREAERWIAEGRVRVDGKVLSTPAVTVTDDSNVQVDGKPLPSKQPMRLWRYHKPPGLVTSHNDPEGRPTVFDRLPKNIGRVISIGRLDLNSEGLLLLTNDGELARRLELPETGWTRRYRVRAHGTVVEAKLQELENGISVSGIAYGSIKAVLDKQQGANAWLTMSLQEGRNREIRKVLEHLGLTVNRLIRVAYGPFQLGNLTRGQTAEVTGKVLREQLSGTGGGAPRPQSKKTGAGAKPTKGWAKKKPVKTTGTGIRKRKTLKLKPGVTAGKKP
ncbi:MAG: rRNA pseudouridine synthase [Alphaproteobacteria bacterium]|nr:rRNA pseudouridine synthase [Alphaproteobacteria bacterium]